MGNETVYDSLGRVERTRRWADVAIQIEDVLNNQGEVVGKRTTGWTTEGALPVADNELSYRRTEYDVAGRAKKSYSLREDGTTEVCTNEYIYDLAGKQIKVITLPGSNEDIGSLKAYMMGLPSKWGPRIWYGVAGLMLLVCAYPFIAGLFRRATGKSGGHRPRPKFGFFTRSLCLLLAFVFVIGHHTPQVLAEGAGSYDQIDVNTWATDKTVITYTYDDNGSVKTKVTETDSVETESIVYIYNLQNRLSQVETTSSGNTKVVEYFYNDAGIRVQKIEDPGEATEKTTYYLVDSTNHTGYAQVLEEETWDTHDVTPVFISRTTYTVGDDIIGHATDGTVKHYLYDGHGSVRQHTDANGDLINYQYDPDGAGGDPALDYNAFHYDGCGNSLIPKSSDGLYYAGEMWDSHADHYYNRARYYNPANGRFNRVDPFAGNMQDPQSLHKYLYCHANPVNGIDPSGKSLAGVGAVVAAVACIAVLVGLISYAITGDASFGFQMGFGTLIFAGGLALAIFGGGAFLALAGILMAFGGGATIIQTLLYGRTEEAVGGLVTRWEPKAELSIIFNSSPPDSDNSYPRMGIIVYKNGAHYNDCPNNATWKYITDKTPTQWAEEYNWEVGDEFTEYYITHNKQDKDWVNYNHFIYSENGWSLSHSGWKYKSGSSSSMGKHYFGVTEIRSK